MKARTHLVFIVALGAVLVAGCHAHNAPRQSDASAADPFASSTNQEPRRREFKEGDDIPLWETGDTLARDPSAMSPVERRLLAIEIPVVDFRSANLPDVFATLDASIKKYGTATERDDETRVRIQFVGSSPHLLTTQYREMPVYEALQLFCLVAEKVYAVEGRIVTVKDKPKANKAMDRTSQ